MIDPTVGRVVWYRPDENDFQADANGQPLAAMIAHVHDARLVNLTISHVHGGTYGRVNVPLIQDGDEKPEAGGYAEWMPFQKGQAVKTEQLEQKLKESA